MKKLNLGCGNNYLEGYINIDAPINELSDKNIKADQYIDINELNFENETISQIFMSAVFEHFPRHKAIFLLRKFYEWLEENGEIILVVPDFFAAVKKIKLSRTQQEKQFWWRHIFGPQDSHKYGIHYDGFEVDKLKYIFRTVGFNKFKIKKNSIFANIEFRAFKTKPFKDFEEYEKNLLAYLSYFEKNNEDGSFFNFWMKDLGFNFVKKPAGKKFKTQLEKTLFDHFKEKIKKILKPYIK